MGQPEGSDNDFNQGRLAEKDAKQVLNDEVIFLFDYFFLLNCLLQVPKDVSRLFNDDLDVEVTSTRSRYSASSGVSRPATSESEGFLDQYHLDNEDDDDEKLNASIAMKENKLASKKKCDDALKSEV